MSVFSDADKAAPAASSIYAKDETMSMVTTKDSVEIFYKDWGQGQPVVFHHGWPLSADDWDTQMLFFGGGTAQGSALPCVTTGRDLDIGWQVSANGQAL